MPKLEPLSYLSDTQVMIDAIHSISDADLIARRPELIEYLECACDFMAWQSAAIGSLEEQLGKVKAIAEGALEVPVVDRPDRWWRSSPGYVHRALFVSGLFFGFAGGTAWCYF